MPYSVAEKGGEKKKRKKVGNPIGDPVRGRDAPIKTHDCRQLMTYLSVLQLHSRVSHSWVLVNAQVLVVAVLAQPGRDQRICTHGRVVLEMRVSLLLGELLLFLHPAVQVAGRLFLAVLL